MPKRKLPRRSGREKDPNFDENLDINIREGIKRLRTGEELDEKTEQALRAFVQHRKDIFAKAENAAEELLRRNPEPRTEEDFREDLNGVTAGVLLMGMRLSPGQKLNYPLANGGIQISSPNPGELEFHVIPMPRNIQGTS